LSKLYFYFSAMNAGKTTTLLQSDFNYRERGMNTVCFLPALVAEQWNPLITSRVGLSRVPIVLSNDMDLLTIMAAEMEKQTVSCIFVDEAQFLSKRHVRQFCRIVDRLDIPVLTYGLRTDFQGELFEGSRHLLAWADHLQEIKTICFCGKKAIMTARFDGFGNKVIDGDQIDCGGNDRYISLCRKHHDIVENNHDCTSLSAVGEQPGFQDCSSAHQVDL
jgi:thymidine kinase